MINHIASTGGDSHGAMSDVRHPCVAGIRSFSTFPQPCLRKLCASNSDFERKKKKKRDDVVIKLGEKLRDVF